MRLYLDTSVIGGYFDAEFREWTIPLIESILDRKHIGVISDLTIREILDAREEVIDLLDKVIDRNCELITGNESTDNLAQHYINEGALGIHSFMDAQHIAIATYFTVSAVISWNFKHIVNIDRIRLFNSVNLKYGYGLIDIRSPREIIAK